MIHKLASQKGMTLLEMLVAMAISLLVMCGAVALILQEYKGTDIAKTTVTAAHEIRNAIQWISQDIMTAEVTDLSDVGGTLDSVAISWTDRTDFTDIPHSISYQLTNDSLQRNYDGILTTVARNISNVEFSQSGRLVTVTIECTPRQWNPEQTVKQTYQIYLRTSEDI